MTPEQAQALRPLLPKRWLPKAIEKLEARGESLSPGFISKVKNAKQEHPVIEEVLFELAKEEQQRIALVDERIASLKNK